MKRFLTLALTFAMCLTLVSCSGTTTSESPASTGTASAAEADDTVYELKLAHIYAADHPFNVGLNQIAQEISDQTDGHVNITVYPAAQLGAETDEINNILSGSIDIAVLGIGEVGKYVTDFNVYEAPYVFSSCDQAMRAVNSDVMAPYYEQIKENGFSILTSMYYGVRDLTCNFPVDSPDDTAGMKIRVPDHTIPSYIAKYVFKANATPMSLSEVYLALQQGVVDGQENPLPAIDAASVQEVQPYCSLWNANYDCLFFCINQDIYDSLTPEQQAVVDECGKLAVQYEREINRAGDDEILSRWQSKNGVEVIPYEDLDIDSFKAVVEPVTEWYIGELKKQGYKDAEELVAAFK